MDDIPIVYENKDIILYNKPPGLPVQPDKTKDPSLLSIAQEKHGQELFLINRLDRPASGIVLLAKNKKAAQQWSKNLSSRDKSVRKTYIAIVHKPKKPVPNGLVKHGITHDGRHNKARIVPQEDPIAKKAILKVQTIAELDNYDVLQVQLITGRFHQIRAQLAHLGAPIKGDVKYGARRGNKERSIGLHAWQIGFGDHLWEALPNMEDNLWKAAWEKVS